MGSGCTDTVPQQHQRTKTRPCVSIKFNFESVICIITIKDKISPTSTREGCNEKYRYLRNYNNWQHRLFTHLPVRGVSCHVHLAFSLALQNASFPQGFVMICFSHRELILLLFIQFSLQLELTTNQQPHLSTGVYLFWLQTTFSRFTSLPLTTAYAQTQQRKLISSSFRQCFQLEIIVQTFSKFRNIFL